MHESKQIDQVPDIEKQTVSVSNTLREKKQETSKPRNWDNEITELETFFKTVTIPNSPFKLNPCTTITNVTLFLESHLATLKNYNGNSIFLPYLNRLFDLKSHLSN